MEQWLYFWSFILNTSVIELLGLEDNAKEDIVLEMSALSKEEKNKICREIWGRGWLTVIIGVILMVCVSYVSMVLADNNIFGSPQMATSGIGGFIGIIIANGVYSIWKGRKII